MIYTPLTCKAMKIAYSAHHGQVDKSGIPYIFHPFHLAEQMGSEYTVCAALLHDVAEDTDITLDDLVNEFPEEVIKALRLLTHDSSTDYFSYVSEIKKEPIALEVKLADLRHNMDISRYTDKSAVNDEKVRKRLEKYSAALIILTDDQ